MNWLSIKRRISGGGRDERGATMVEFALVGFFLLFFVVSTAELLRLTYTGLTLQYVVTNVVRTAVLGSADPIRLNSTQRYYADAAEMAVDMESIADGFGVDIENTHIEICGEADTVCAGITSRGGPDQLVVVRIRYPMTIFWWGEYTIDALAVGKNERF